MTLLAGSIGGAGNINGTGATARLAGPQGVATDTAGNAYFADGLTVRKLTSAGVVTTFAGAGDAGTNDGAGTAARFYGPSGVAVDTSGNVYVADGGAIRKISASGQVTTLAGVADREGAVDGTGSAARFSSPNGLAVDAAGNLYVADGNATIRKVTSAGVVTTVAGKAFDYELTDGTGINARFLQPSGVAVDGAGNLYATDSDPSRVNAVRKITPGGVVTTLAGGAVSGAWADGTGAAARFNGPSGIAVDSTGNLYVGDTLNQVIRKISPSGQIATLAGQVGVTGAADGAGTSARFFNPAAVALDAGGNILVGDTVNHTIRKLTPSGTVSTIAGTALLTGAQDGIGAAAGMAFPGPADVDAAGNTFVADVGNNVIRKISASGVVTTFAGTAGMRGTQDGTGAAARFSGLSGLTVDTAGNVYVADSLNCVQFCQTPTRINLIRKITPAGVVTTLAGSSKGIPGLPGLADGIGGAAIFYIPSGLDTDAAGNLYVADCGNGAVRKISTGGVVTTLAPSGVCSGSVLSNLTSPSAPNGLAVDSMGNIYVSDSRQNVIRKVTASGAVSIVAGGSRGAADGTGKAARFDSPQAIAVDAGGNMYIADTSNHAIRMMTTAGAVTTIAGKFGSTGVMLGNLPGSLTNPMGVAVDSRGVLTVTTANGVVKIQ